MEKGLGKNKRIREKSQDASTTIQAGKAYILDVERKRSRPRIFVGGGADRA